MIRVTVTVGKRSQDRADYLFETWMEAARWALGFAGRCLMKERDDREHHEHPMHPSQEEES